MMLLRLIGPQGIAGLAASICLALLLVLEKGETRHWKKQSREYQQLHRDEQAAFAGTVANYRAAAEQARAADRANADRVAAEQRIINERIAHDFEARLAVARAAAERLRSEARTAGADHRDRRAAPVPGLSAAAGRAAQSPGEDGLPHPDRLIATEQAIQLDELIKWVRRQHSVDPNEVAGEQAAVDPNADPRSR